MTAISELEDFLPMATGKVAIASDGAVWLYHPPSSGGMIEILPPAVPTPPTNSVAPSVTAVAGLAVGNMAAMNAGTWQNSPTFTQQWTSAGADIPGATATSYTFQASDLGNMISGRKVGTNQDGSLTVQCSNSIGPIVEPAEDPPARAQASQQPQSKAKSHSPMKHGKTDHARRLYRHT